MLGDGRQLGGRDNLHLNNSSNSRGSSCTDHPWPTSSSSSPYSKLRDFFRKEMGLANSKHKMTCDKKKKQQHKGLGLAAKEHITKAPLATAEEDFERPDVAGNSCGGSGGGPKAPSPATTRRWNRSVGRRPQQKKHCLFVKGRREEECRFVENSHHGLTPDAHPSSSRKCSPAPSTTRFKGQANCGSPVNGRQQQCQGQESNCIEGEPLEGEPYGADMPDTGKQDLATHHHLHLLEPTLNSDADCEADKSSCCGGRDRVAATTEVTKLESLNHSKHYSHSLMILSAEVPAVELNSAKEQKQQQQQQQQHQQNSSQMGDGSMTNTERLASSTALGPKGTEQETREPAPAPETQQPETETETRLLWTSRKRRAVRDQIRRVVVELEGILRGLKEVHLEMKEVVQQIELLTSDIDPPGDQPHSGLHGDASGGSRSSGGVTTVGGRKGEQAEEGGGADLAKADNIPSPQRTLTDPSETNGPMLCNMVADDEAQPTGNRIEDCVNTLPTDTPDSDSPPENQSSEPTRNESKKTGVCKQTTLKASILGPRNKKPPPYPHHHNLKTAKAGPRDKGKDCPKPKAVPPYPVKRRLLSTTV
ncbi:uncharacterized protein LOC134451539 [Engraulis encrasicolus]|uniref:uncharacterized protein LOC134451539 n=1 Tax=Engraulis encrasicolus TaxID=184585 RepID=UPI002FD6913E